MKARFFTAAFVLIAGAFTLVCLGCNPVDLRSLMVAAKKPDTLLQLDKGDDYVVKFRLLLISAKALEEFGLVPTVKFGDEASATWVYNIYNVTENRFLFPIKIECRNGKIAEIRLPGSAADALPPQAVFGFVRALATSDFDLRAGKTVPDPAVTYEIDCQVPLTAISDCLGRWETVTNESNIAEYRYALRLGRGRHAADVLLRCAYRQLPERFLGGDIFLGKLRIGLSPEGAQLKLYNTGYRRTVAAK